MSLRKRSTEWLTKIVHECHIQKRWKAWCRNMSPGCRPPHWGKTSWCIRANRRNCMVSTNLKEKKKVNNNISGPNSQRPEWYKADQSTPKWPKQPKLPKVAQIGPKWPKMTQREPIEISLFFDWLNKRVALCKNMFSLFRKRQMVRSWFWKLFWNQTCD